MYMMAGIILVVGVSQLSRLVGGLLGIIFWGGVAFVGSFAYDQGGGIGLPGVRFSREIFYAICAFFISASVLSTVKAWSRRGRSSRKPLPPGDSDEP